MKWRRARDAKGKVVENVIESDRGYRITRCMTNGKPLEPERFIAFWVVGNRRLVLGGYDSSQQAKNVCATHCALTQDEQARPEEIVA